MAGNLYVSNIVKYILESNKFFKNYENKEKLEELISEKEENLKEVFKTFEDFKNNVSKERLGKFVNLRGLENFISKLSVKDAYSANIAKYIFECNAFLKSHENEDDLEKLIFANKSDLKKVFKTSKDFENKVSKERLDKFINLRGVENFISKLSVKDAYSSDIIKYILKNNNHFKSAIQQEDLEELISSRKNDLKKVFETPEDFKNEVSKERLGKFVNLRGLDSFISTLTTSNKTPKVPKAPMLSLGASPEKRKYATVIASVIINCNAALKQYKKVVPKDKVNSEKNKEQIINAVLTCKNFDFLKENFKNSSEFLMNADIDVFHKNKTPEDVTRSLNAIIDRLKKEKRTAKLGGAGKKYLLDARDFIERKSKFPQAIKIRCLNEFCEFIERNIKILSGTYDKFKEIVDDTDFYEALQDNSLNTFEKFQKEFIKNFKLAYKKVLKPLEK